MKHRSQKPPGQRQLRVAERIRHLLSDILREGGMHDPDLANPELITVTAVEMGPDLKHAHVFVMPLGGKNAAKIVEALNRAAGFFRAELGPRLDLRYAPKVSFRIDNSFEESDRIDRLLRQGQVQKDLQKDDIDD
jgi:ribosome-binding factor A